MEHPLRKDPLTASDDYMGEERDLKAQESVVRVMTESSEVKKVEGAVGVAATRPPRAGVFRRMPPFEEDADVLKVENAPRSTKKFVEVRKSFKSVRGMDDPLRHVHSPEDASETSAHDAPIQDMNFDTADNGDLTSHGEHGSVVLEIPEGDKPGGSGAYIVKVNRISSDASGEKSGGQLTAMRTIADFVWLETRLRARYEGLLIPFLPETMNALERLKLGERYFELRRFGLERFLRRVLSHPVLGESEEARTFIGALGQTHWQTYRNEAILSPGDNAIAISVGIRKDQGGIQQLMRWIKYRIWQVGRRIDQGLDFVLKKGREEDSLARDVTAKSLEKLKENFEELGKALISLRKDLIKHFKVEDSRRRDAERLQRTVNDLAERSQKGDLALLDMLAEAIEPSVVGSLQTTLYCSALVTPAEAVLLEVVTEYVRMFQMVRKILSRRFTEREAYEHAVAVYNKLREQFEALESALGDAADKKAHDEEEHMRENLNNAAADLADVRLHYQNVINVTYAELHRYRNSLSEVLSEALRHLAAEKGLYFRKLSASWEAIVSGCTDTDTTFDGMDMGEEVEDGEVKT